MLPERWYPRTNTVLGKEEATKALTDEVGKSNSPIMKLVSETLETTEFEEMVEALYTRLPTSKCGLQKSSWQRVYKYLNGPAVTPVHKKTMRWLRAARENGN